MEYEKDRLKLKIKDIGYLRKIVLCILATIVLIAFDQVTKAIAQNFLSGKGIVNVLGDFVILEFIKNRGAFLSVGHELDNAVWMAVFVIIPVIVLCAISVYIIAKKISDTFYLSMWVLVLSGGLGNLIDRVFEGKVTDFMNIGIGTLRTGIFNVADLYIVFFTAAVTVKFLLSSLRPSP